MTATEIAAWIPLALGTGVVLLCAAGLLVAGDVYDRLHVVGPASILGPVAVALALAIAGGPSPVLVRAVLIAAITMSTGPVVAHATARAARLRARGNLEVKVEDESRPP